MPDPVKVRLSDACMVYGEKGELDGADYFVKSVEEITGIV